MGTGSFPGVKCGRGVLLTTHSLLGPSVALSHWACYGKSLPLYIFLRPDKPSRSSRAMFCPRHSVVLSVELFIYVDIYYVIGLFRKNILNRTGTAVAQWLRCCATNRQVAGSIPAGVIGTFHRHKILPIALWPWGRLSL